MGADLKPLHGGLAGNRGDHDFAVLRGGLFANDHSVAVEDRRVAHAVSIDGKSKVTPTANPRGGNRNLPVIDFRCSFGPASDNSSEDADAGDCGRCLHKAHLAGAAATQSDVALAGKRLKVVARGARGGPAELRTQVAVRRRRLPTTRSVANRREQLCLRWSKRFVFHGRRHTTQMSGAASLDM